MWTYFFMHISVKIQTNAVNSISKSLGRTLSDKDAGNERFYLERDVSN